MTAEDGFEEEWTPEQRGNGLEMDWNRALRANYQMASTTLLLVTR